MSESSKESILLDGSLVGKISFRTLENRYGISTEDIIRPLPFSQKFNTASELAAAALVDFGVLTQLIAAINVSNIDDIDIETFSSLCDGIQSIDDESLIEIIDNASTIYEYNPTVTMLDFKGQRIGVALDAVDNVNYGDGHEIRTVYAVAVFVDTEMVGHTFIAVEGTYSSWDSNTWHEAEFVEPHKVTVTRYRSKGVGDDEQV